MLKVFLDESGTHEDSPVVTVSAVFAKPTVWQMWTKDWNRTKGQVKIFHAVDVHNCAGEFTGWSVNKRTDLVKTLLPIIPKHKIGLLLSGIDWKGLRDALGHRPEILQWFGHPYLACLHWIIPAVCERARAEGHSRVAFLHEQNQYRSQALDTYDYLKRKVAIVTEMDTSFSFGSKGDFPPLQCADIVAYEGFRQIKQNNGEMRKPILAFDPNGSLMFKGYSRNDIQEMASALAHHFDELDCAGKIPRLRQKSPQRIR